MCEPVAVNGCVVVVCQRHRAAHDLVAWFPDKAPRLSWNGAQNDAD